MAEVYPYAAMVALWNLPKTIKYKRGSDLVALTRLLPQADDKLKFVGHPPATQVVLTKAAPFQAPRDALLRRLPRIAGDDLATITHELADSVAVIGTDRGLFLSETWRLHPDIRAFTSPPDSASSCT